MHYVQNVLLLYYWNTIKIWVINILLYIYVSRLYIIYKMHISYKIKIYYNYKL